MMWKATCRTWPFYALLFAISCGGTTGSENAPFGPKTGDVSNDSSAFVPPDGGSADGTDATSGSDSLSDDGRVGTDANSTPDTSGPGMGYVSPELYIQIVGPSADDHVAVGSGITYLAGVLFGTADSITWESDTGQTGSAQVSSFWQTTPITLIPGDNRLTVKATSQGKESVDSIIVTYNPGFYFAKKPRARPSAFFTKQSVDVVVTIGVTTKNFMPSTVTLWEVDEQGNTLGQLGTMVDTGDTTSPNCDEIQDDSVFSRCVTLQSEVPTIKWLRVSLKVQVAGTLNTIFSPIIPVEIVDPLKSAECQGMHQALKDARALYMAEVASGNANPGASVITALKANPNVIDAGVNSNGMGIWTLFKSGTLGALNLSANGFRGGTPSGPSYQTQSGALGYTIGIESKKVLALAPFNNEFGSQDEVPQMVQLLKGQTCPEYQIDGPHLGSATTVKRLRAADEYGMILLSGHADIYFSTMDKGRKAQFGWEHDGSQEIIWTGDPIQCSSFSATMPTCSDTLPCNGSSECVITQASGTTTSGICIDHTQIDLRRGRIVMGAQSWGIHPLFFRKHARRLWPSTMVYLGACRTLYNGTLAGVLFGLGAKAVVGFTDYVTSNFAYKQSVEWLNSVVTNRVPVGKAVLFPISDSANTSGQFQIFGGSNVVITDSDIINADFEKGDTIGWNVEGDGRVISQLGISIPVTGKFMGILSTGLGYTQQTGELNQSFCIAEGTQTLTFYWKFFSEEFKEWCGSIYQDTFQATLESKAGGKLKLVSVKVDDLCPVAECAGCGGQYIGLVASDVSFDQGGVYNTQWQPVIKNISNLAGAGPVTLRLFATDQGDSIYDTVILVDSVVFE